MEHAFTNGSVLARPNQTRMLPETSVLYLITTIALLAFFVSDAANKILITYSFSFYRVSIIIRTFFELVFILLSLAYFNKMRAQILTIIFLLSISFIAGQLFFVAHVDYPYSPLEATITLNKYLFVFIIYAAIYKLKDDERKLWKCSVVLEYIFVLNSIAIFLGLLTEWEFLKTYIHSDYRYGYMGLIPAPNEATLFYFLAVSLLYYKRFVLKRTSKSFFVVLLAAVLVGTKGIYIFLILLLLFHLLFIARRKIWLVVLVTITTIGLINFFESDEGRTLLAYFYDQARKREWLSMLLSGRDLLLRTDFSAQIGYWSFPNYLFGGQDVNKFIIEMDFFDMFLFFGVFGSLLYGMLFAISLFRFRHTSFTLFFTCGYFALAFAGGHFFNSAVNALYLCLVCLIFAAKNSGLKNRSETYHAS